MRSWTQQLHQPAMLTTVPHSSYIQFNIILPPNAWSHEEWSILGWYTVLLGISVLIFGMITVPQGAAWPWRLREPRILRLGTAIQTTAAQLMFTWEGLSSCLQVPMWTLSKELLHWHLAQFVLHILPACLPDWLHTAQPFLKRYLVSVT